MGNKKIRLKFPRLYLMKITGIIMCLFCGIGGIYFLIVSIKDLLKTPFYFAIIFLIMICAMIFIPAWDWKLYMEKSPVEIIIDEKEILYKYWPWQKYRIRKKDELEDVKIYVTEVFTLVTTPKILERYNTVIELIFKNKEKVLIYPYGHIFFDFWIITLPLFYLLKPIFKKDIVNKIIKEREEIISIIKGMKT